MGREDPLEKEMATHSSILAWEIPWTGETWRATVHGVTESDMTEQLNNENDLLTGRIMSRLSVTP